MMTLTLSATQQTTISGKLVHKDAEGNPTGETTDITSDDLDLEIQNPVGNFGELDDSDNFNPGDAGATGEIHATYTDAEGAEFVASAAITLVAGEAATTELVMDFEPKPE